MNRIGVQCGRLLPLVQLQLSLLKAERWILASCLVFCCILSVEIFLTAKAQSEFRAEVEAAQTAARQNWLSLGDRDPHGAAHHGTYLFKPVPTLSQFDPGFVPYLGTTIRAEAHVRHRVTNRPAENSVHLMRTTLMTPAGLVQGVLPLLLILLGCGTIARERQQQNLSLMRGLGVPWGTIVLGKVSALTLLALTLAGPYLISLMVVSVRLIGTPESEGVWLRGVLLVLGGVAYLLCWCCFIVGVSARTRSAQMSLVVLLCFWTATTCCLPALTANVVSLVAPLPSQEEVHNWSQQKMFGNGNIFRTIRKDLEDEMLAKYQVNSTEELPFHFDGLAMLESEKATDKFYQQDAERLASLQQPFVKASRIASFISPYLSMHQLTMGLAGTDEWHHQHFDDAAEAYRQHLVKVVNEAYAQKKDSPEAVRGEALWKSVRKFEYRAPAVVDMLHAFWTPLLVLTGWSAASLVLAMRSERVTP